MTNHRRNAKPPPSSPLQGACGYADLAFGYATGGLQGLAEMAALIGYRPGPQRSKERRPADRPKAPKSAPLSKAPATIAERPLAELLFWQPTRRLFLQPPTKEVDPPSIPPSPKQWDEKPPVTDLAPWNALLPRMRSAFTKWTPGKGPDVPALLRSVEKGRLLDHLPRRPQRRWGPAIQIITDHGERLAPFYGDQARVETRLRQLFPAHGVEQALVLDGVGEPILIDRRGDSARYRPPSPGTLVVVLGDLGCLAGQRGELIERWIALGKRLAATGCRAVALTPCPRARWQAGLARWWTMLEWDRGAVSPADPAELSRRVERLLTLVSPAIRLEPGLLRDLRRLLGPAADAGTESDLWQHPALVGRSGVAGTLDPAIAADRRAAFHNQERELAPMVVETLRRRRAGLAGEIWLEELLRLDPAILPTDVHDQDLPWARWRLSDLASTLASRNGGPAWFRRFYRRGVADVRGGETLQLRAALSRMYAESFPEEATRPPPPPGFDPRLVGGDDRAERNVALHHVGGSLVVHPLGDGKGSLLATLRTVNGLIHVDEGETTDDRSAFWKSGKPPSWAQDWGRDEFGAWATFGIDDATQRLRWIPPGRFLMGSPKDEPGRNDVEGPQHAVTLSRGYWLFDTPCTQALWQAVMGANPSNFQSPDRPVETVSWNDVQGFLTRINGLVPGLDLVLPTEAQWELACRAGTDTALYSGGIAILGENNAPALDPIAWYGGNSGVGFDLDNGVGSADWSEKQHPHEKAGTRPVGRKRPNPWGLHDMLGNVDEWCADGVRDYTTEPETDPRGPESPDAMRVLRGGSWDSSARFARAACRFWSRPGVRVSSIGFRCARVQAGSPASPEDAAEPTAPALPRLAERRGTQGAAGGAVLRVASGTGGGARCPLPQAPAFHIRTDREELRVERIARPEWADALGRDRFGLWTEITVEPEGDGAPVTQRLRWIPPGRFLMGSPADEPERDDDEGPQHAVTLSRGYWLFDTACTQALWQAVMGENPSEFQGDDRHPVDNVSWDDAQNFLSRLNAGRPGLELSLPTEAQWEHACRAGTTTPFSFGAAITPEQINYDGNHPYADGAKGLYRKRTVPVASLPPNPWGLYEMHGNLWEWCADGVRDYTTQPETDPRGPESADARHVLRGGSWYFFARYARAACRDWRHPDDRNYFIGFRCARVQP